MSARIPSGLIPASAALAFAACLASCSLRLPVEKSPVVRTTAPAAVATALAARPALAESPDAPDVLVWLTADTYHTGMVFPFDWLLESGFIPPADFRGGRYVALSWGNRDAYSEQGIDSSWKMLRVLFSPTPSVMELIPFDGAVVDTLPGQRVWRGLVPRDRGPALARFLNGCVERDTNGRPVVVRPSSWGRGVQLESSHSYFIPRVCNVWSAQAIEALGGRINPWFALTADSLARQACRPPNPFEAVWPGGGAPEAKD